MVGSGPTQQSPSLQNAFDFKLTVTAKLLETLIRGMQKVLMKYILDLGVQPVISMHHMPLRQV